MTKPRWFFYGIFFPITLLISGWGGGLWWLWASSAPNSTSGVTVRLTIPEGTPLQVIGKELEAAGVIRSSLALRIWLSWARVKNQPLELQAGTYDFVLDQPLNAVVDQMQTGKPSENRFTILEGWTIDSMADYFQQQGYFRAEEFVNAAAKANSKDSPNYKAWLPQDIPNLEGFLYPDTYQLSPDQITPDRVIGLMLNRFEEVALPLYAAKPEQLKLSLKDWVTLASIVEKEAVLPTERGLIAGVFWQRLKRDMPLGADPTVEYALKIKQTKEQPLTLAQVKTPSPYNTYINIGLPPGAIASPGLDSLKSVLEPELTEYLYFVARYDGSHIFSRTLEDHEKAQKEIEETIKQEKKQ